MRKVWVVHLKSYNLLSTTGFTLDKLLLISEVRVTYCPWWFCPCLILCRPAPGDVRTSPTAEMLHAVTYASLLDDLDRSDTSTKSLEAYMARLCGKEAGLFVPSGTMGNLVSIRSLLTQPPYAVLCDDRAHILANEAGGAFSLASAVPQPVHPANNQYLTLEDITQHVNLEKKNRFHMCPT